MKEKTAYLLNEEVAKEKVADIMDKLDLDDVSKLITDTDTQDFCVSRNELQDIKERTFQKLGVDRLQSGQPGNRSSLGSETGDRSAAFRRSSGRKGLAAAAIILLCLIAWGNGDNIVSAVSRMISLIPGVGIIEDNQDILYQLKEPVVVENEEGTLDIQSAVATRDTMTVSFEFTRKNYTEEQMMADKNEEWEKLKKGGRLFKQDIYLVVNNQKYKMTGGSSTGGLSEYSSYSFDILQETFDPSQKYTFVYGDFNISADFQMINLKQYSSLDEIGSTEIHNNISLTALTSQKDGKLSVNVYPVNYSGYNLISFDQDYDLNYFGKKLTLKTELGDKDYTLPGSYGSGMNAAYTFDVGDGSKDYTLSVPYVVVESKEEAKVTLPIPKVGVIINLNKRIDYDKGSLIIKSVEKVMQNGGNPYGDLKVDFECVSKDVNWQLVSAKLTNKGSEGYSEEFDDLNRIKTIYYMLNKSDRSKLKLYLMNPRYAIMDEYNLDLNK